MSRPKPIILKEFVDQKRYKAEQILAADAIYAVFYEGKPINLRTISVLLDYPGPKYPRCMGSNGGHIFNLAEKLNKIFETDKFEVFKFTKGEKVTENPDD